MKVVNRLCALLWAKIVKIISLPKKKPLWVLGGSVGKRYVDNGAALHQYLLKNHPEIDVYWIINKNSPDLPRVKKTGPFLYKDSFKGNLYTLLADVLVCTHELPQDVSGYGIEKYKTSLKVFISHGVEGLKKKTPEQAKVHQIYDVSVSVSDIEKSIKTDQWKLDKNKVCITGLPRYDLLEKEKRSKKESIKDILYMPTWRPVCRKTFNKPFEKLTRKEIEDFKKSAYYHHIKDFVCNPSLLSFLEERGVKMHIFFHPNTNEFMKKIIDLPETPFLEVFSAQEGVHEKITKSDLLVTDYSSVCWDFLYLNRPVIFYQFDREDYLRQIGSYLKMPEELFGAATENAEDTIRELKKLVERKDEYFLKREESRKKFIKHRDGRNCERVVNCILDKLNKKNDRRNS